MISAGLLHLAARAALALALSHDPTPATSEATCDSLWTRDSDTWHDCRVALEQWRSEARGECDVTEVAPYQAMGLPDPAHPGQSYVTKAHDPANGL
jgi:hypothetical protein